MATNDLLPPFLRAAQPQWSTEVTSSPMTEHVVVFEYRRSIGGDAEERWWKWCPVSIADGMGVDEARVRWSKPHAALVARADEPDVSDPPPQRGVTRRPWFTSGPLFHYDAYIVEPG